MIIFATLTELYCLLSLQCHLAFLRAINSSIRSIGRSCLKSAANELTFYQFLLLLYVQCNSITYIVACWHNANNKQTLFLIVWHIDILTVWQSDTVDVCLCSTVELLFNNFSHLVRRHLYRRGYSFVYNILFDKAKCEVISVFILFVELANIDVNHHRT